MAKSFDWKSIELPKDMDYDELYDQIMADPQMLDQLVKEYLKTDQKWIENEKKLNEMREKREEVINDLRQIEANNKEFDQLLEHMNKSITSAKYFFLIHFLSLKQWSDSMSKSKDIWFWVSFERNKFYLFSNL